MRAPLHPCTCKAEERSTKFTPAAHTWDCAMLIEALHRADEGNSREGVESGNPCEEMSTEERVALMPCGACGQRPRASGSPMCTQCRYSL